MRGDIFAKDKAITHVFVDGKLFEQKPPPKPEERRPNTGTGSATTPPPSNLANVAGVWAITIQAPGQALPATLNLTQQGENLTGTLQSQLGTSDIKDGKVSGDGFTFTTSVAFGGSSLDISVSAKVSGNQVSGTVNTPQGAVPFTGTKNP
jgi:hypothetical protein